MNVSAAASWWFPDRTPTWIDVTVAAFAIVWMALTPTALGALSWAVTTASFVAFSVGLGPLAKSSIGTRIERWGRAIGLLGRATVVIAFAVGVWITGQVIDVPMTLVTSFAVGGMLAIAVFVLLHVLHAREVAGWRPT